MSLERREVLGLIVTAAALAGCAGTGDDGAAGDGAEDGTDGGETTTSGTTTDSPDDTTSAGGESNDEAERPAVQVASHSEYGDVLADSDGRTLYMFDQDTQGEAASTCYDSCAETWPPLTVSESPSAGSNVTASLETFARENGDEQVTADGWPLYYFAGDSEAGDANGQAVNDVWWVLAPDGTPKRTAESTAAGAAETTTEPTAEAAAGPY